MEQIFIDNPRLDVAYKTADGHFFFLENDAVNYASTLEDKTVKKVTPKKTKEPAEDISHEEKEEIKTEIKENKEKTKNSKK